MIRERSVLFSNHLLHSHEVQGTMPCTWGQNLKGIPDDQELTVWQCGIEWWVKGWLSEHKKQHRRWYITWNCSNKLFLAKEFQEYYHNWHVYEMKKTHITRCDFQKIKKKNWHLGYTASEQPLQEVFEVWVKGVLANVSVVRCRRGKRWQSMKIYQGAQM